ncbi:iron binding protein SufA for iron-sulfur cluster assembly [Klebsiella pneumoniae]|nr:iron binding protein SufA for iron-sulfur cluster assembly [Klebsiella pneumoniae]
MEVQAGTFNPADFSWQGLTMTPAAAAHIRDLMRKQPDKKGLRLGIKTSGCAGIGEDQLFYCLQRGISEDDAISMIVNGFCKDVFSELPLEFAVEAQKLLAISLEHSVG